MRVLFILKRPGIAGIETLALRLISELIQGYDDQVGLLFVVKSPSESFFKNLHPKCEVYSALSPGNFALLNHKSWDVIYGFESFGLLFGAWLSGKLASKPKLCIGIYHPLEYSWLIQKKSWLKDFLLKIFKKVPISNLVSMNDEVFTRTQRNTDVVGQANIVPLPIDTKRFAQVARHPQKTEIVSLGRLVDFKTYNLQMIHVIHELQKKGHILNYKVYGDGDLKSKMIELSSELGLQDRVQFMGSLSYEKIHEAFQNAYCFVGCGTSLIEAAATGLPSLVGIESSTSPCDTYGFFSDTTGFNVGEMNSHLPQFSLLEKIEYIMKLNSTEYERLADAHQKKADLFNLHSVSGMYRRVFLQAKDARIELSTLELFLWTLCYFFYMFLNRVGVETPLKNRYVEPKPTN